MTTLNLTKDETELTNEQWLSMHARVRMHQRNFNRLEINYVLEHAERLQLRGRYFYFLGLKNIPTEDRRNSLVMRLEGTTIIVSAGGTVITIYKDPQGLRQIKKMSKFLPC